MIPLNIAESPLHPQHLQIWSVDLYRDENLRTWVPKVIKTHNCTQVLWHQADVPLGEPLSPSELAIYEMPLMWQLYPGQRYLTSGSMYWRIVYHIKFRGLEEMLLEQLPSGN